MPAAVSEILELHCAEVKIGERHRHDMGDLESLAASIEDIGLLQPIGVTDKKQLVFGERRLRAVKEILRQPTIAARVVSVPSILHGEYHENEIRKDFTISERVAIAAALKAEIKEKVGERRGRPAEDEGEEKPQDFGELNGRETAEIVAERAGFGNPETFRQAEKVVQRGHADLIAAMDAGEVSISAAAKLAELPKSEQRKAAAGGKEAIREALSERTPQKPISEVFFEALKGLAIRIDGIKEQYETVEKMFKSKLWQDCDTYLVIEMVHELHISFRDLDKEMQAYAKRNNRKT